METELKSPTESLAARREARRKKILENSNIRLTKITGREHDEVEGIGKFTQNHPKSGLN